MSERILNVFSISLLDEISYKNNKVYMYIKWKTIDYTININEVIEENVMSSVFIEYWLFVKKERIRCILSKIYQRDELYTMPC